MAKDGLTWQAAAAANLLEARKKNGRLGVKKSRSGCLTCKSRRVKCDETKPECNKCRKAGRKCGGYSERNPTLKEKSSSFLRGQPSQSLELRDSERRTFDFFLACTAPRLAGSLDKDFWCGHVLQLAEAEPLVLDSLLAISTLYEHPQFMESFRRNPYRSTKEGGRNIATVRIVHPNVPPPPDEFHTKALKHYNKAIRALQQRIGEGTATPLLALLSCALFFCIEMIRDNIYTALSLFARGTGLLQQYAPTIAEEKNRGLLTLIKLMFSRAGVTAATFGVRRQVDPTPLFDNSGQHVAFANMSEARTKLFALMANNNDFVKYANAWKESHILDAGVEDVACPQVRNKGVFNIIETMYDVKFGYAAPHSISNTRSSSLCDDSTDADSPIYQEILTPSSPANGSVHSLEQTPLSYQGTSIPIEATSHRDLIDLPQQQAVLLNLLSQWYSAFQLCREQHDKVEPETLSYLLMYYHSTFIWLSTRLSLTQTVFDDYTDHFEEMLRHAEIYVNAKTIEQPTFTFEVGAVPLLYLAAAKCRIPSLRRRALDLFRKAPRKECMHGAESTAEVACRLIEIEEEGLGLPAPDCSGPCSFAAIDDSILPPEDRRIHNLQLLKNTSTQSHEIRITRYSHANGRVQRNIEDFPI